MAQEPLKAAESQARLQEAVKSIENPEASLQSSLKKLEKFGGFDLLESAIDAVQNINPERKARKKIFLEESAKKAEREQLKKVLEWWSEALSSSDDLGEILTACQQKSDLEEQVLKKNLKAAGGSYAGTWSVLIVQFALFYKNTESTKVKNISIVNADMEQLQDLDNTRFIDAVQAELVENYDRLDLRENYGMLVIPGYLGSNKVVEKWAKIAYENKVMLVTDFEDLDAPDDVMELFEAANLTAVISTGAMSS